MVNVVCVNGHYTIVYMCIVIVYMGGKVQKYFILYTLFNTLLLYFVCKRVAIRR